MAKYLTTQKLWRIIKQPGGYYYEIKLAGMIVDRVKIDPPAFDYLKNRGLIDIDEPYY